ncbi:molybdopterin-synthase adenylyltransferase MoeB [Xanthomonas sp. MUS 060]|uniref:molybdopterin-synthase adenylyltransferase MoeB n=1 Tax=Xanthomonas sp. MUS 060 TaxID=1588031 RepID=UPI0005F2B8EC|nr:molybdopterin-synthase adenylyltransferase MoeB [Xanthomonas sp. MUS 060]
MHGEHTPRLGAELEREEIRHYSRHLMIPEIGCHGQRRLKGARVLLVGVGGLGSPAALYLAASGVGAIGIVEFDQVEVSNLQRQVLYGLSSVGMSKGVAAAARLADLNPHVHVVHHETRLNAENALELIRQYDVVVDGTDNFPTRYLVNDACVLAGKPNVYASIFRFEGMLSVFNHAGGPCYRCLYPEPPPPGFSPSCAEGGVFGVLPGIMGTMQAAEVIKLITGVGRTMEGRLLQFDATEMRFRELNIARDPDCPICGDAPTQRHLIDYATFCGVSATVVESNESSAPELLQAQRLAGLLQSSNSIQLIDVRSANEFEIVHLDGALLMPLDELEESMHLLDRAIPVVCYCKSGVRSMTAARCLLTHGFSQVYSLEGGIAAWARDVAPATVIY